MLLEVPSLLSRFRYVKAEAADFDSYVGCCALDELQAFMFTHGYVVRSKTRIRAGEDVGNYYAVV